MNMKPLMNLCLSKRWLFEKNRIHEFLFVRNYTATSAQSLSTKLISQSEISADVQSKYVNPLRYPDYFEVNDLVKIKELFDAKVHLGHKLGSLNNKMKPYIFGSRFEHIIFDLEQTAVHLRKALNFTAHIAYRGGIILFVSNHHQHCPIIEQIAKECKEYAHTRSWKKGLFTNSVPVFGSTIRFPDLCIILNTLDSVFHEHELIIEAAKLSIPTIGIVDSNCDPTIITYPVPGNDDSLSAIQLYLNLFKQVILKGKAVREKELKESSHEI